MGVGYGITSLFNLLTLVCLFSGLSAGGLVIFGVLRRWLWDLRFSHHGDDSFDKFFEAGEAGLRVRGDCRNEVPFSSLAVRPPP